MVDTKVTALTEDSTPAQDDLVMTVDDPAGSPVSKKAALRNLFPAISGYGAVYTAGGSGTQTITGPTQVTQWDSDGLSSAAVTPDATNDKLTLVTAGKYLIGFNLSFEGDDGIETLVQAYLAGSVQVQVAAQVQMQATDETHHVSAVGVVSTTGSQDVDVRVTNSASGDFDLKEGQLWALYLGP